MTTETCTTRLLALPAAGITLAVTGAPGPVAQLQRITAPFWAPVAAPLGQVWTLALERRPACGPATDEPAHGTVFDVPGRRITVHCAEAVWLPVFGMRYARTLARAAAIGRGAVPLHGAAVAVGGVGVVVVGAKMAGKTTTALSLARSGSALVSNDDALLVGRRAGRWRLVGGPRSIGIRLGSLDEHQPPLPDAAVVEATAAHPANRAGKRFLHPCDVGRLGGRVAGEAQARVLVELVCAPGATTTRRLDDEEAAAVLRAHLELAADRRRFDLLAALGAAPPALTTDTVGSLVRGLAFHRVTHPVSGWVRESIDAVRSVVAAHGRTNLQEVAG